VKLRLTIPVGAAATVLLVLAAVAVALASSPMGVTPTVLARGTYDASSR
jgi:hypothetical protein